MYKKVGIKFIIVCIIIIIIISFYLIKLRRRRIINIELFNTEQVQVSKNMPNKNKNTNKNTNNILICIGDSILNNTNYVPIGKSVIDYLRSDMEVINVAQDNAKIDDVYDQLRRIPDMKSDMNTNINMEMILSVGGNDLLDYEPIENVYGEYVELVRYIKDKYIDTYKYKLYVLNLYYPTDKSMKQYYERIRSWNGLLNNIPVKYDIDMNIIDISKIIKEPTDLVEKIEPSITGGLKIADKIIESVN